MGQQQNSGWPFQDAFKTVVKTAGTFAMGVDKALGLPYAGIKGINEGVKQITGETNLISDPAEIAKKRQEAGVPGAAGSVPTAPGEIIGGTGGKFGPKPGALSPMQVDAIRQRAMRGYAGTFLTGPMGTDSKGRVPGV